MPLHDLRAEWEDIRDLLDSAGLDRVGACDDCGAERVAVRLDVGTMGEGDLEYCAACWTKRLRHVERRIKDLWVYDVCPICGLSRGAGFGDTGCERCGFGDEDESEV